MLIYSTQIVMVCLPLISQSISFPSPNPFIPASHILSVCIPVALDTPMLGKKNRSAMHVVWLDNRSRNKHQMRTERHPSLEGSPFYPFPNEFLPQRMSTNYTELRNEEKLSQDPNSISTRPH